ncbi:MAG: hypothetical protein Q8P56_02120 [Candidatus Uhrbacteria bacterium]|nr:hypothetical protein [Candidatus Uhrbacteria bacterium]
MAEVLKEKEVKKIEDEKIVFEKERKELKTVDNFELLKVTLEQIHTLEMGISAVEKLWETLQERIPELPGVSETLESLEEKLGVSLAHETKQQIEQNAELSAARGIELLHGRMIARKEYLERRREDLEMGRGGEKEQATMNDGVVTIDANFDTLAEHEKIEKLPWKTVHEDGVYRIKTAVVSIPGEKDMGRREVHLVLIENKANVKDDVVLALEKQPRADMLSIPEVFEELEKMGTTKNRNVVEIDADRRKFYEDLIRADLLRGSIVDGPNGSLRLTIREQAVPWSFLPPDEFVAMGKINARKYDGSMDAIKDVRGQNVPKEVFLDERTLQAYLKGGSVWEEHSRKPDARTYTTKYGEQASQDKQ